MSNINNTRANVKVQLNNIATSLRQWDNWGIYLSDKKPITLASAINCTDIGFKINDLSAHGGSFEDAARIITTHDPEVRERVGRPPIVGPSLAIEERLETVVIDLDDPQYKLDQRREEQGGVLLGSNGKPMTDAEFARAVATETETHQMILRAFRGHYVETSMSGAGYHIFVRGRLGEEGGPIKRYRIGDYDLGLVFSTGSIYMTGDLIDGSRREILDGQSVLDEVVKYFTREDVAIFKEQRLRKAIGSDGSIKSIGSVDVGLVDRVDFGRRLDMNDEEVIDRLRERFPKTYVNLIATGGWTNHSACKAHLIGDLDKITGSAAQIDRIMLGSNFMMYAGLDKDGHSRFKKYVDGFAKELRKARESNDETLAKWERQAAWKAAEIERGRAFFKVICGPDDPGSLAYKKRVKREKEAARIEAARLYGEQMTLRAAERKADKEGRKAGGLETGRYTIMAVKAVRLLSEELGLEQEGYFVEDLVPPGLTGELCMAVYEGMYEPFIKFAIPATFAGLAGIVARKFKTSAGHGLHIFAVLLALPTIGKTQAIDAFRDLDNSLLPLRHHRERYLDVPVASRQGFHATLEHGCFTWVRDECKPQLRQILAPQKHDAVSENMQSLANQMFDLGKYKGAPYRPSVSIRSTKDGDKPVRNLCVSTFWGTTKDNAAEFLTPDTVNSGIISRMLIVSHLKAGGKFTPGRRVLDSLDGEGELARNLIELHTTADSLDVRYLYEPGKDASGNELPRDPDKDVIAERDLVLVPLSEEAAVFWDRLQVNISEFKGLVANGESMFPKYYLAFGRAGMIAHRIASIMAVLEYGGGYDRDGVVRELRVELHQFKYAIGYVLTVLGGMVSDFDTGESGATGADLPEVGIRVIKNCARKAIREAIAAGGGSAGDGGSWVGYLKYRDVSAALRNDRAIRNEADPIRKVNALLQELADGGLIEYQTFDPNGRVIGKTGNIQLLPHKIWEDLYI